MLSTSQRNILLMGRWFGALPVSMQSALAAGARTVNLPRGGLVFRRHDSNDGLYGVLEGAIRFSVISDEGKETVVGLAGPPNWFGEVALLDGGRRTHDAWADTDCVLVHVSLRLITSWLVDHPAHWKHIGQLATHKLRVMFTRLEDDRLQPVRTRLIRCVVTLLDGYGQREPGAQRLRVSQERLATLLSLSRQTVNELLRELERERLVSCNRGGLEVLDLIRLRELGQPSA
ncbi:Crp/Fnr family transcriptional regulator [Hylemonella sp. W303a]|uniref:Crp/Fnr family transcriptional regulator n=1 Tax=Hylemonella sp. W303a TaxID=3389873 RepID=UPI00396AFF5D